MQKDILISDVDGTILDRMPIYQKKFGELAEMFGADRQTAENYYYESAGTPIDEQFGAVLPLKAKKNIQKIVKEFFTRANKEEVKPFPRVVETFCVLAGKGVRIVVSSGSDTKELERILLKDLKMPISLILGSDIYKKGNSHIARIKEFFGLTAKELSERGVFLGDGSFDMSLARQNKIFAVGITNTLNEQALLKSGANVVVRSIEEIEKFF
jgi:phosphoglycolate phosphatase-like HAD superfamily hydrolase